MKWKKPKLYVLKINQLTGSRASF